MKGCDWLRKTQDLTLKGSAEGSKWRYYYFREINEKWRFKGEGHDVKVEWEYAEQFDMSGDERQRTIQMEEYGPQYNWIT